MLSQPIPNMYLFMYHPHSFLHHSYPLCYYDETIPCEDGERYPCFLFKSMDKYHVYLQVNTLLLMSLCGVVRMRSGHPLIYTMDSFTSTMLLPRCWIRRRRELQSRSSWIFLHYPEGNGWPTPHQTANL